VGRGATAYLFGLRHAFDADHIAVIDNATRKLMNDGDPRVRRRQDRSSLAGN
jgi:high-affinity nickel permease